MQNLYIVTVREVRSYVQRVHADTAGDAQAWAINLIAGDKLSVEPDSIAFTSEVQEANR